MTKFKRTVAVALGSLVLIVGGAAAASADVGPQDHHIICC